jgi:hypothetical protein
MARRRQREEQQPIRKSFLITGGVAIAAALIGFVLMTFVLNGDGGDIDEPIPTVTADAGAGTVPTAAPAATPAPAPTPKGLTPGGRDPFARPGGVPAPGG